MSWLAFFTFLFVVPLWQDAAGGAHQAVFQVKIEVVCTDPTG
jgi:hypothetical protein